VPPTSAKAIVASRMSFFMACPLSEAQLGASAQPTPPG
jgi:hypothetical protein